MIKINEKRILKLRFISGVLKIWYITFYVVHKDVTKRQLHVYISSTL